MLLSSTGSWLGRTGNTSWEMQRLLQVLNMKILAEEEQTSLVAGHRLQVQCSSLVLASGWAGRAGLHMTLPACFQKAWAATGAKRMNADLAAEEATVVGNVAAAGPTLALAAHIFCLSSSCREGCEGDEAD